jgi:hypothetical protein
MNDKQIRSQIDTENVKGLLYMNGGGAAALLAFLSYLLNNSTYKALAIFITVGLFLCSTGLITALIHNHLRRRCSFAYESSKPRKKFLGIGMPEPLVCHFSHLFMWSSYIFFGVAAIIVFFGCLIQFNSDKESSEKHIGLSERNKQHISSKKETNEQDIETNITNTALQQKDSSNTIGDIKNNTNTQVNVNSPSSTQIINEIRKINKEYNVKKSIENGIFITKIIFTQTNGIWNQGEKFKIAVELTGSFKAYKFLQGFHSGLQNVVAIENAEKTFFHFETTSAPLNEHIILQIESEKSIDIKNISVHPVNEKI